MLATTVEATPGAAALSAVEAIILEAMPAMMVVVTVVAAAAAAAVMAGGG